MSGADEQDIIQWQDALRWLDRAATDISVSRILIKKKAVPHAAFNIQQAVEKILKALLVAARQDIRKTHDLAALAGLANEHWPDLVPDPFMLDRASRWYAVSRYPGIEEIMPAPSDVKEALTEAQALFASVIAKVPPELAPEAQAALDQSL